MFSPMRKCSTLVFFIDSPSDEMSSSTEMSFNTFPQVMYSASTIDAVPDMAPLHISSGSSSSTSGLALGRGQSSDPSTLSSGSSLPSESSLTSSTGDSA